MTKKECFVLEDYPAGYECRFNVCAYESERVPNNLLLSRKLWSRNVQYLIQERDGHHVLFMENTTLDRKGTSVTNYENLRVFEPDKKEEAEAYALAEARKMAEGIARPMGIDITDFTLEEAVALR